MQFDWTTFALELLNFLVLVWLLKRFFYSPILAALDARRQAVRAEAEQAAATRAQAAALQTEYAARLQTWEQERAAARQALAQEIEAERTRELTALHGQLDAERAKAAARQAGAEAQAATALQNAATSRAYAQAAAMLTRLAAPALTARIAALMAEDLQALEADTRAMLQAAAQHNGGVELALAHALEAPALAPLQAALAEVLGHPVEWQVQVRPELIAGVRIAVGERLLQANLADELRFFQRQDGVPDARA